MTVILKQWDCYVTKVINFSVEAARLGDVNEKQLQLCNKNKMKFQQETREINVK